MHELSIAQSLAELAASHVPSGSVLRRVRIRAGALRAIDPQALQWAWESLRAAAGCCEAELDLVLIPWTLRCAECGQTWHSPEIELACACGCHDVHPTGSDELLIESIDVSDPPEAPAWRSTCKSPSSKTS
jgi:hydrogenase nickel incorporation protein HypA/HybF